MVDSDLRRRLAGRLSTLIETSGSLPVLSFLKTGISSPVPSVCAAFIDLFSHVVDCIEIDQELLNVFNQVCVRTEPEIVIAVCDATGRSQSLWTDASIALLKKAFDGSISVHFAAVRALETAPGLTHFVWDELLKALDDKRTYISSAAANAVLKLNFQWDESRSSHKTVLKALKGVQNTAVPGRAMDLPVSAPKERVADLLTSPIKEDRILAVSLLPWVNNEERFVLDRLLELLKSNLDRQELVSAISSLRLATTTHKLLKFSDVDLILSFLDSKTRDVRIAAVRLGGAIASSSDTVCKRVIDYLKSCPKDEYRFGIRALLESSKGNSLVSDYVFAELARHFVTSSGRSIDEQMIIIELLRACQELEGATAPSKFAGNLQELGKNYKEDHKVRREALGALANVGAFERSLFVYFIKLLNSPPPQLGSSVCRAVSILLKRARRRMDSIRAVFLQIQELESAILGHIDKLNAGSTKAGEPRIRDLRLSIENTQHILKSYSEFSSRTLVNPQ